VVDTLPPTSSFSAARHAESPPRRSASGGSGAAGQGWDLGVHAFQHLGPRYKSNMVLQTPSHVNCLHIPQNPLRVLPRRRRYPPHRRSCVAMRAVAVAAQPPACWRRRRRRYAPRRRRSCARAPPPGPRALTPRLLSAQRAHAADHALQAPRELCGGSQYGIMIEVQYGIEVQNVCSAVYPSMLLMQGELLLRT
jgi:hypothetical protein